MSMTDNLVAMVPLLSDLMTKRVAAKDWDGVFCLVGRDHAFDVLLEIASELTDEERGPAMRNAWEMPDHITAVASLWRTLFRSSKWSARQMMTAEEHSEFDAMPERMTLYRGFCSKYGTWRGMSWTDDIDLARFFARYRSAEPSIAIATITKRGVAAFIKARGSEREFIVPRLQQSQLIDIKLIGPEMQERAA
ncbi:MAG: hypothetical protein IPF57_18230 [Gammaproteobacteria bacterium]|nr:hypothetical protein [Gammaproteobacteria bacterium]MBK8993029.1 hypothetical protein [Gammaproteobacteria bacterium]MBK9467284.1 hypothetical protein [Gammaproteobacteria bacterium]MBP6480037.1 hypothetical protein [Pseudomonadales bacterium]MBP7908378.1 hypothetical protein [Pseudomonadales bacterium]